MSYSKSQTKHPTCDTVVLIEPTYYNLHNLLFISNGLNFISISVIYTINFWQESLWYEKFSQSEFKDSNKSNNVDLASTQPYSPEVHPLTYPLPFCLLLFMIILGLILLGSSNFYLGPIKHLGPMHCRTAVIEPLNIEDKNWRAPNHLIKILRKPPETTPPQSF